MGRLSSIRENFGEQAYEEITNYDLWIELLLQGHKGYQEGHTSIEYTMNEPDRYTRIAPSGHIVDDNIKLGISFSHLYQNVGGMWIVYNTPILIGGE